MSGVGDSLDAHTPEGEPKRRLSDTEFTVKDCIIETEGINSRIVLTAPHGGRADTFVKQHKFKKRQKIGDDKNFKTKSDLYTIPMMNEIRDQVSELSGGWMVPHTIALRVYRGFIDGNRGPEDNAYPAGDDFAKRVYDAYHERIQERIAKIEEEYGPGSAILIDIHGQIKKRKKLWIGNKEGKLSGYNEDLKGTGLSHWNTVRRLIEPVKDGDWGVYGWKKDKTQDPLSGAYTVQKVSGYRAPDNGPLRTLAIQFEFGLDMRQEGNRAGAVEEVAQGIYDVLTQ